MDDIEIFKYTNSLDVSVWITFADIYERTVNPDDRDPIEVYEKAINTGESELFLISLNKELIGFYLIDVHSVFNMLNHISILSKYRRRGYASELLHHLKGKSTLENKYIIVETTFMPLHIYKEVGFKKLKMNFYVPSFVVNGKVFNFSLLMWGYNFFKLHVTYEQMVQIIKDIYAISYYLEEDDEIVKKTLNTVSNPPELHDL